MSAIIKDINFFKPKDRSIYDVRGFAYNELEVILIKSDEKKIRRRRTTLRRFRRRRGRRRRRIRFRRIIAET